jgi:DNA-binding transcriptional regulator LsrR (DeoR family)
MCEADVKLIGIGAVAQTAQLVASGSIKPEEIIEIARSGALGEMMRAFCFATSILFIIKNAQ